MGERVTLNHRIVCIVGPTASGKSALAQIVASKIDGEVVSADSMQIYRGMDIGTGKIPVEDRIVAHYGFDIANPGEPFSAALFQEYSRRCFKDIDSRNKTAVLCGGTGFYVRAAIDDYEFPEGEQVGNEVRDKCLAIAEERGPRALWDLLNERDPESAAIVSPNDVKRVARAFELLEDGTSYATQKQKLQTIPELYPSTWIGLSVDPDVLKKRIDQRVDSMVADGLVNEVENLLDQGLRGAITAQQAIGYKEIVAALDGRISLEEAIEQIKIATHRYAKRQRTWFRKEKRIHWIDATTLDDERMLSESLDIIEKMQK